MMAWLCAMNVVIDSWGMMDWEIETSYGFLIPNAPVIAEHVNNQDQGQDQDQLPSAPVIAEHDNNRITEESTNSHSSKHTTYNITPTQHI